MKKTLNENKNIAVNVKSPLKNQPFKHKAEENYFKKLSNINYMPFKKHLQKEKFLSQIFKISELK